MPYDILRRGSEWCIVKESDGKVLGCHSRRQDAVSQLRAILANEGKQTMSILKAGDGTRFMFIVTSNAYRDREKEWISSAALEEYVQAQWEDNVWKGSNFLLFWHQGPSIGDIVHADMEGPFLFELAREREDGPPDVLDYAKAIWDYVEKNEEEWGASHGFAYGKGDVVRGKDGLVYNRITKFETTVLPVEWAANTLTFSGVIQMSDERDKLLDRIGGDGFAKRVRALLGQAQSELDASGFEHKMLGPIVTRADLVDVIIAIEKALTSAKDEEPRFTRDQVLEALDASFEVDVVVSDVDLDVAEDGDIDEEGDKGLDFMKEWKTIAASQAQQLGDVIEQQGEIVEATTEVAKAVGTLIAHVETIKVLANEVAAIKTFLKKTPRRSSVAKETEMTESDEVEPVETSPVVNASIATWPGS